MRRAPRRRGQARLRARAWLHHLGQGLPWYAPGDSLEGRNARYLYAETAWFGLLSGLTATFVSVYALRLGATTDQVGWLTALPALVNVVWLIPAARLIERQRKRMPLILAAGVLQRLGFLAMALMPFLLVSGRVEALIVLNTAVILPAAVISTAVTSLLPELAKPDKRGQMVTARWIIMAVTATLAALLGGRFLDLVPVPLNYQILLGVGTALSLLGLVYLGRIRVPDRPGRPGRRSRGVSDPGQGKPSPSGEKPAERTEGSGAGGAGLGHRPSPSVGLGHRHSPSKGGPSPSEGLGHRHSPSEGSEGGSSPSGKVGPGARGIGRRRGLGGVLRQREFMRFALAAFVFHWGLYLPAALWSVLRVRELGASDSWIGLIAVVVDGATIAGYFLWGKARAKRGDRWLLLVTGVGVTLYAAVTAVVPSMGWMVPSSFLGGLAWAGCNLALFNVMLTVCPGERRPTYLALYTALMNVAAFAGPLLGTALAGSIGIRWVFVLSGGVRLVGTGLFAVLLGEKRPPRPRKPRRSKK